MRMRISLAILAIVVGVLAAPSALAQSVNGRSAPPSPSDIGFDQRLGERLPLDVEFNDEAGQRAPLSAYFGRGRPVVLAFAYYECPMLCTMVLNGLVGGLKGMSLTAGADYDVVVVSIDPRDTPEKARAKKASYMGLYGHPEGKPGSEGAFHFLTGDAASIRAITGAAGFRYVEDPASKQFAHASGAIVLTEHGEMARYLYGIDFAPRDLRLALVEAGNGTIGGPTDRLLLLCYQYDPTRGKYGALALGLVRAGGVLTLVVLGASILVMSRRKPGGEA